MHIRGGQAKFLEAPLIDRHQRYLEDIARRALEPDGLVHGMVGAMENLSDAVFELAPVEFWNLRASGHPTVESAGTLVYDRPPAVHRLTEEELAQERRALGRRRA